MAATSVTQAQQDFAVKFASAVVGASLRWDEIEAHGGERIIRTLTRQEEIETRVRDQWGCWDWQYSEAQRRGQLYVPWIDRPLARLRQEIQQKAGSRKLEPLWPNGKAFALCLTHDVDEVSDYTSWQNLWRPVLRTLRLGGSWLAAGRRLAGLLRRTRTWRCQPDPLWHYEDWLKVEDRHGFKSSFFFFPSHLTKPHWCDCMYGFTDQIQFNEQRMTVGEMMREINQAGWEVGLHGSYYSATTPCLLTMEKEQIEDVLGKPVVSTRQHWLNYDAARTPQLQDAAGLKVDTTQGFNRSIGFRAGTCFPYSCWDHQTGRALDLIEIPMHIMDGGLFSSMALEYDEETAIRHGIELMQAVQEVGGCLTLNWHPQYLNDEKKWNVYQVLLGEAARQNAWGCSAGQLYAWWQLRERRIWATSREAA